MSTTTILFLHTLKFCGRWKCLKDIVFLISIILLVHIFHVPGNSCVFSVDFCPSTMKFVSPHIFPNKQNQWQFCGNFFPHRWLFFIPGCVSCCFVNFYMSCLSSRLSLSYLLAIIYWLLFKHTQNEIACDLHHTSLEFVATCPIIPQCSEHSLTKNFFFF